MKAPVAPLLDEPRSLEVGEVLGDRLLRDAKRARQIADRRRPDLAHRFLDAWLGLTGDYAGLAVLRYYLVYRALVRAKVTRLRAAQLAAGDALAAALAEYLPPGCEWQSPKGGMFFWIRLPAGLDAMALLPRAVDAGIAYVPGAAFYAHQPDARTLRLSFVTLTPDLIREGVEKLGRLLHEALDPAVEHAP